MYSSTLSPSASSEDAAEGEDDKGKDDVGEDDKSEDDKSEDDEDDHAAARCGSKSWARSWVNILNINNTKTFLKDSYT